MKSELHNRDMDLATQPLFRLLGAVIVLTITATHPIWGIFALIVWIAWIYYGTRPTPARKITPIK